MGDFFLKAGTGPMGDFFLRPDPVRLVIFLLPRTDHLCLYVCLSICMSAYLPVCLSTWLSASLPACLSRNTMSLYEHTSF